jgi:protein-S-isoprenylcysteine O-methyltransferase Ste14
MHGENIPYGYGFWSLVIFNAAFFVIFVLSFLTPLRRREWRSFGVYSAFIVALFTEMYGFPLTIYVLTSILGSRYPALNPFSHASGHLWVTLLGGGAVMMTAIHIVSNVLMFGGLVIIACGWSRIHRARGALVTTGLYRWVRHPQYSGLFLITIGLLIQWPTIVTLLTWPFLLFMYGRLARREEAEMERQFGEAYRVYAGRLPRFIPRLRPAWPSEGPAGSAADPSAQPIWTMKQEMSRGDRPLG